MNKIIRLWKAFKMTHSRNTFFSCVNHSFTMQVFVMCLQLSNFTYEFLFTVFCFVFFRWKGPQKLDHIFFSPLLTGLVLLYKTKQWNTDLACSFHKSDLSSVWSSAYSPHTQAGAPVGEQTSKEWTLWRMYFYRPMVHLEVEWYDLCLYPELRSCNCQPNATPRGRGFIVII